MKTLLCSLVAVASLSVCAFADQQGPYSFTYGATPVNAPVSAINPPPGSIVVNTANGEYYKKISPRGDNSQYARLYAVQTLASAPVTTNTITADPNGSDQLYVITPAGTIAALTFVFPTDANSHLGQKITVVSHQVVTALTVSSSSLTIRGTAVTALAVDTAIIWQKIGTAIWQRLQ